MTGAALFPRIGAFVQFPRSEGGDFRLSINRSTPFFSLNSYNGVEKVYKIIILQTVLTQKYTGTVAFSKLMQLLLFIKCLWRIVW